MIEAMFRSQAATLMHKQAPPNLYSPAHGMRLTP